MGESEFSKGQEALLKDLIQEELSARDSLTTEGVEQLFDEKVKSYDENRTSIWNIAKNRSSMAMALVIAAAIFSYIADTVSGNLFLNNMLHEVIGTEVYVSQELERSEAPIATAMTNFLDEKYDFESDDSAASVKIREIFSNLIKGADDPEHPIAKTVYEVLNDKPVLVFQGEATFGQKRRVHVTLPGCKDSQPFELKETGESCELSVDVEGKNGFSVPFYASLFDEDGNRNHDIVAMVAVSRHPREDDVPTPKRQPGEYLQGVEISYIRETSVSEDPDIFDITENFVHNRDAFFFADVGDEVINRLEDGTYLPKQSLFHAIDVQVEQEELFRENEIIFVQLLIFINKNPK